MTWRIYFDFNDWWIGYYRGPNHHYICVLPTLVLCVPNKNERTFHPYHPVFNRRGRRV